MTATDFNFDKRPNPGRRPLFSTLLTAVLAVLVAACVVLIAPAVWTAMKAAVESQQPELFRCAIIDNTGDRLACYDRLGNDTLRPPAKGANAPLGFGMRDGLAR